MTTHSWRTRLYQTLLRETQKSSIHRHAAYMAAGWLSLVGIRPELPQSAPTSLSDVARGGILLLVVLCIIGPLLNSMKAVFNLLGQMPARFWPLVAGFSLLSWRYARGRTLLTTFAKAQEAV